MRPEWHGIKFRPGRGDIPVGLLRVVSRTMKREGQENGGAGSTLPAAELGGDLFWPPVYGLTLVAFRAKSFSKTRRESPPARENADNPAGCG